MGIPSSVLNTNIASIIAQRNLAGAQESLATSVERLSSGLRINDWRGRSAGGRRDAHTNQRARHARR
ncbi:MAG: hypothetical protein EB116_16000 [Betaproteobacteria bacterium]|nr:hypothetical protein [Betaproteobacteria bacterium]